MELVLASEEAPREVPRSQTSDETLGTRKAEPATVKPLGESQAVGGEALPPMFCDLSLVQIHGIEKKPELNEKIGVILSFDGGPDRRYTVKVSGNMVRLREDKLKEAPEGWEVSENNEAVPALSAEEREARAKEQAAVKKAAVAKALMDAIAAVPALSAEEREARAKEQAAAAKGDEKKLTKAIEDAKTWDIDVQEAEVILKELQEASAKEQARLQEEARKREEANIEFIKGLPQGDLTSTGRLLPTYAWVQVPSVASLPQGMEIWMLGGFKCARIPASWRLQIVAEGQADSYRVDVGEKTLVYDVLAGAASRFGWETQQLQLQCDGKPFDCDSKATVGSAGLFGLKLTARRIF